MNGLRFFIFLAGVTMWASAGFAAQRAAPGAESEAGRFDGSWTIEAKITVGSCPALIPDAIEVKGDLLDDVGHTPASSAPTTRWGYVESDGTIVARFTTQGRVARAHGQLRGNAGSGAWSSSTDMCGGVWKARRGGAERAGR